MAMGNRDRRALQFGGAALLVWVALQYAVLPGWDRWEQQRSDLPMQEMELIKYRQAVGAAGTEKKSDDALASRLKQVEGGLLQSATPALASAELQDWAHQAAAAHAIEVHSSEFLQTRPQAGGYLLIPLGVEFQCHLDQLADFLTDVRSGQKILAIPRLQIHSTGGPDKMVSVSMTLSGVMRAPASATPQGAAAQSQSERGL
jgi:type II secretory pathway component PulM